MRSRTAVLLLLLLLPLVLGVATASPARAGEEGGLDLGAQIDVKTIGVSIGVFVLLLIVLSKTAWKPILAGLQKREDTIREALDEAQAAHDQAKALIAEYEAKIDKAREEAQAIFDEARRDAQDIREQIEEDARKQADEAIARAAREIAQQHAKAWDGLVHDAAAIAGEAAKRIIQRELDPAGHAEIVAGVVGEFARSTAPGGESA